MGLKKESKIFGKKFDTRKMIINLCIAAVLGALGTIIMIIGGYCMRYPIANWLVLEPSDTVILVTYILCGWQYSIICAIIKAAVDILAFGPTGPICIGQITAVITSLVYITSLSLCKIFMKKFEHHIGWRILAYVIMIIAVSTVMTLLNYIFITPTYLSWAPDSCFNPIYQGTVNNSMFPYHGSLFAVCFFLYFPFNLIKGLIVCALFEIIYISVIPYFTKLLKALLTPSDVVVDLNSDSSKTLEEKESNQLEENNDLVK